MRKHRAREYLIAFQLAAPESLKIPLAMLIMIATARFLDEVIGPSVLNWLQPTDS